MNLKTSLRTLVKIGISILLIWYLVSKNDTLVFYKLIKDVNLNWILIAGLLFSLSNILGAWQWNVILNKVGIDLSFRKSLGYYYSGLFFNNFLLSFVGGDAVRIYDVSKHSGKNPHAVSAVFLDRILGLFSLTIFAVLAAFIESRSFTSGNVVVIVTGVVVGLTAVLTFLYSKPFAKKFEKVGTKLIPDKFHRFIRDAYNSFEYFRKKPKLLLNVLLISLVVQSIRIVFHYSCARSLGVDISIIYFFLFIPIITVILLLPIAPGGIGLREVTTLELFGLIGIQEEAAVFATTAFIVAVICSFPGILTFVFRRHHEKE